MTYVPQQIPSLNGVDELRDWVQREFLRVAQGAQISERVTFNILYAAPPDPVAGMLVFADGTTWNPGSGRGLYEYRTSSWVKL